MGETDSDSERDERTFFVSRTGADAGHAKWIAKCLDSVEGWTARVQDWDFTPAQNWGHQMHELVETAHHIVAVLSPDYFSSGFGEAEWLAGFVQDPLGKGRRVIPVRVRECELVGFLRGMKHVDLVGIPPGEDDLARTTLLDGITAAVNGSWPRVAGPFPGTPGAAVDGEVSQAGASGPLAALQASGRPPHRRLFGVAERNPDFVGRVDDLRALAESLATSDVSVSASIEALAGVGKTELATMLVHALADGGWFGGGIYWLPAQDPDLTPAWAALATGLGLAGTADELRAELFRRIAAERNPVLIVLDNVEAWPLPDMGVLPSATHRLLVTTRVRGLGGRAFLHRELGLLTADEARSLLVQLVGEGITDQPGFDDLLEELDGHALSVELAGAVLADAAGELTPAAYLDLLRAGEAPEAETRHGQTVHGALAVLFERLSEDDRLAWMTVARFQPEWISVGLLDASGVDQPRRQALSRWHLVERGELGVKMHRSVVSFGRQCGDETQRDAANNAHASGLMARARQIDVSLGHQIYLPDRAHFDRAAVDLPASLDDEDQSYFLDRLGTAAHAAGLLAGARALLEQALASDLASHGEEHPEVATRRSNLAGVLQAQGDLAGARALLAQALASGLASLGEEHPHVAIHRSKLAGALHVQGDLAGARALLEQALASDLASLVEDHPSVAIHRNNLALVLKAQGDLAGARTLLEQALSSDLASLGAEHPEVATRRSNLALVLQDQGDLAGARTLLEQALASDLANHGKDHPEVATRRGNLACVLKAQGDLAGARALLEQALASGLASLGEDHPSVATSRLNLAALFYEQGDLDGAATLERQVLEWARRAMGPDHPRAAHYAANLMFTVRDMGRDSEARELAKEALRVARLQPEGSKVREYVERSCGWAEG